MWCGNGFQLDRIEPDRLQVFERLAIVLNNARHEGFVFNQKNRAIPLYKRRLLVRILDKTSGDNVGIIVSFVLSDTGMNVPGLFDLVSKRLGRHDSIDNEIVDLDG